MSQIDPDAPWVPPDPPQATADGPTPPAPAGDLPALLPVEAPTRPPRFGDDRRTTVLLAAFAAVVLLVCGGLAVTSLTLSLPDQPYRHDAASQPQAPDGPAESHTDETPVAEPTPDRSPTRKPASTPSNGPGRFAIAYAVTGQGPADIQYRDADGYLIQLEAVPLPWRRTIHTDQPGLMYMQAAKAFDEGERTITCAVVVDGRRVTETVGPGGWRCSVGSLAGE
ncbi:MmpS family transport accessory protein [Micromonospora sp. NPDC005707]|uniref:MmpS family transport accessory protein n=1 Tax=Micromonospora sp. NPDC005707 TaxID=3157050 RepID=UPI0033F1F3D6